MTGRWVQARQPDGSIRQDWVPVDQPPSPDATTGEWHVVGGDGAVESRWEWHPTVAAPATPPDDHRAAVVIGGVWGAFVILLPGIRTPLSATWDNVGERGSSASGIGLALLLAVLVAVYGVAAAGIAWGFARMIQGGGMGSRLESRRTAVREP